METHLGAFGSCGGRAAAACAPPTLIMSIGGFFVCCWADNAWAELGTAAAPSSAVPRESLIQSILGKFVAICVITLSTSSKERQTSWAAPSPWLPTPLPPYMKGCNEGCANSECSTFPSTYAVGVLTHARLIFTYTCDDLIARSHSQVP